MQERFVYRHKWRRHDLLQWDNRCVFHAATDYDTAKELRVLYRTIVEGEPTSTGDRLTEARSDNETARASADAARE